MRLIVLRGFKSSTGQPLARIPAGPKTNLLSRLLCSQKIPPRLVKDIEASLRKG